MTTITYRVSWKETWCRDDIEFTDIEKAKAWAKMKKEMGYREVRLEKIEATEIQF